jgi:hypothetical protein
MSGLSLLALNAASDMIRDNPRPTDLPVTVRVCQRKYTMKASVFVHSRTPTPIIATPITDPKTPTSGSKLRRQDCQEKQCRAGPKSTKNGQVKNGADVDQPAALVVTQDVRVQFGSRE